MDWASDVNAPGTTRERTARARFAEVCKRASLRLEQLAPHVVHRMLLLAQYTETFDDGTRIVDMAERVFEHCEATGKMFSPHDQDVVRIGSLFSDIGKTGPKRATRKQQRLVARMFSIEGVRNDQMPVAEFFATYFAAEQTSATRTFVELGLDPNMPMRSFWNLHSEWTFELLRGSGIPPEAIPAAAAHHLLEHINPSDLVADDGSFTHSFGRNSNFDRPEKLVILLDKYDAVRRRGRRSHDEAITWLRQLLARHPRFPADQEFESLIDALDVVFARGTGNSVRWPASNVDPPRTLP
jgi:hypothetical protein